MYDLHHQVLRTDVSGMPLGWVNYQDAVRLYHLGQVAYSCGVLVYCVHGGICALEHCNQRLHGLDFVFLAGRFRLTEHQAPLAQPRGDGVQGIFRLGVETMAQGLAP